MRGLPSDFAAACESEDADQGDGPAGVEHPGPLWSPDIALHIHVEHEEGDDPGGDGQLDHQDPVHAADEVPPDGFVSKSSSEASRGVLLILFVSTLDIIPVNCALLLRNNLWVLLGRVSLLGRVAWLRRISLLRRVARLLRKTLLRVTRLLTVSLLRVGGRLNKSWRMK